MRSARRRPEAVAQPHTPPAPRQPREAPTEVPAELHRRFAHFRRSTAPRTRVPIGLRRAVLDALDQGVSMLAVRRDLGLTAKQIESWRPCVPIAQAPAEVERAEGAGGTRIFDVADKPVAERGDAMRPAAGEALELRLGAWSVVIRTTRA